MASEGTGRCAYDGDAEGIRAEMRRRVYPLCPELNRPELFQVGAEFAEVDVGIPRVRASGESRTGISGQEKAPRLIDDEIGGQSRRRTEDVGSDFKALGCVFFEKSAGGV